MKDETSYASTHCRLCLSTELAPVLDLPETPPANEFVPFTERHTPQDLFPLDVVCCRTCAHVQLRTVVNPERLFGHYRYVSGTASSFRKHLQDTAAALVEQYKLRSTPDEKCTVIEIGSNDGTMLKAFQDMGLDVLGIDPAEEISRTANDQGLHTICAFFNGYTAARVRQTVGLVDMIVANNVFAHADNLAEMAFAIHGLLKPNGVFVAEVSYVADVIQNTLFDTIYHEHLSYHGVIPLYRFLSGLGLSIVKVDRITTHGGSIRIHAVRSDNMAVPETDESVLECFRVEESLGLTPGWEGTAPAGIFDLAKRIQERRAELTTRLKGLKSQGKRIVAYGAPAKATTLMYAFGLDADTIEYIVDDAPLKQGMYSPGLHIPVVPSSWLYAPDTKPDVVVVLAWNFADPIIADHQKCGATFIVPLPSYQEFPSDPT